MVNIARVKGKRVGKGTMLALPMPRSCALIIKLHSILCDLGIKVFKKDVEAIQNTN